MRKSFVLSLVIALFCTAIPAFAESSSSYPTGISERSVRKMTARAKKPVSANKLSSVCKSVKPLSGALLKNAWPGHISKSDPRASGFAFVCGADCPKSFPVSAYYSDGSLAFKLGYYGRWEGNGKPRAYCGAGGVSVCSVSSVTKNSRSSKRDGKVYLDFGGKSCRSATPGQRNGSTGV